MRVAHFLRTSEVLATRRDVEHPTGNLRECAGYDRRIVAPHVSQVGSKSVTCRGCAQAIPARSKAIQFMFYVKGDDSYSYRIGWLHLRSCADA